MIKIIVDTQKQKDDLIKESQFVHDNRHIDTDKCNTLAHLYLIEDHIEVRESND